MIIKLKSFNLELSQPVLALHCTDDEIVLKYQTNIFVVINFTKKHIGVGYIDKNTRICSLYERTLFIETDNFEKIKNLFDVSDEKDEKKINSIKKERDYVRKKINRWKNI